MGEKLKIEYVSIDSIMPYVKNAIKKQTITDGKQGGIMIDVIIQRYENLTGKKAVLLND